MARKYSEKDNQILEFLSVLPERIITLHGTDNIAEFLLYDICHHDNFLIKKAAFFIDSPDFNCLKGLAGINTENKFDKTHWEEPDDFSAHMNGCSFNQLVRDIEQATIHNSPYDPVKAAKLAKDLDFNNPMYHSWQMKHENRGFIIYETQQELSDQEHHLHKSLNLLGFCPVF